MSKKVIGILGGMGPLATADLFQKITLHTVAACDQAHPRVCIDSNTDIADRTAALLHGGEDPVPEMIKSAKRLESIGADFLIMPCNTAHNYYEQVCEAVTIPVLHMIALTRDALMKAGVNVRLIDQGSSELNIIVGVDNLDFEVATRAIYRAFVSHENRW